MKDLQMHFKRIEAANSSLKATVFSNNSKMDSLVGGLTRDDEGMKELKVAAQEGRLNAVMILDEVNRITSDVKLKCAPMAELDNMKTQAGKLETLVNDMKAFRTEALQRSTDNRYEAEKNSHDLQELKH